MSRSITALALLVGATVAGRTTSLYAQASAPTTPQVVSQAPAPAAQSLIDDALKTAKADHKVVLVDFSTTGCGWCVRFEKFVHSAEVGGIMSQYFVPVTVRVEEGTNPLNNAGSADLMKSLGGEKAGYPYFAFLDENGKKIADSNVMPPSNGNIGHPAQPQEIQAFDVLLQKTAPKMSASDREKISAYLTEMQKPRTRQ